MGETFIEGLGTVRECQHCGCLVAGGPTACMQCTKTWVQIGNRANALGWRVYRLAREVFGRIK